MSSQPFAPIELHVDLGERAYPITIGQSLLADAELIARNVAGRRVAVVTNTVVAPLYLERLSTTLQAAGKQVTPIILPDGEEEKNWENLMRIFDVLLKEKCDRKTTLMALGGGVIGDMTGFAAATYMRGVPFVQVPTTLLAQVDSSVGGKTGINHPLGKNMIGAFYQPQAVIADTLTLDTLAPRELSAGLAEVIKHGAIIDAGFFDWIEDNIGRLMARDAQALALRHPALLRNQGRRGAPGRARRRLARHPQFRPYLRPCDRGRPRLRPVAARRSRRLRHGDGGRTVAAPGLHRCRRQGPHRRAGAGGRLADGGARSRDSALDRTDAGRQEERGRPDQVHSAQAAGHGAHHDRAAGCPDR